MPVLYLFSSQLERDAAFPQGVPSGLLTDVTGVGLVESGIGASRSVLRHAPAAVVYLGTCGAYRGQGFAVGDLLVAHDVAIGTGDVAGGAMRLPSLMRAAVATDPALSQAMAQRCAGRQGRVVCTLGVTETDELAALLQAAFQGDAENLEAFSVVQAAAGVPVAVVLGVTNIVGAGGGAGWAANYKQVMQKIAGAVTGEI